MIDTAIPVVPAKRETQATGFVPPADYGMDDRPAPTNGSNDTRFKKIG